MRRLYILIVTTAAIAACSPLQQAPLVYSSRVAVGVDVSTSGSESPGLSITLGVKTIDAAYVPVAVSKAIDPSASQPAATPEIIKISAQYGQGATDKDPSQLTEANKQKISAYIDARKAASDAATVLSSEDGKVADLKKRLAAATSAQRTIDSLGAPPVLPAPAALATMSAASAAEAKGPFDQRDAFVQKTLNPQLADVKDAAVVQVPKGTVDVSPQSSALKAAVGSITNSLPQATKAAADAGADAAAKSAKADELLKQAAQAASLLETSKTDAMSVFGRFDSNSNASIPGGAASGASAGLLIGKVFSTGLASQNLTEAAKIAAVANCLSSALSAAGAASGVSSGDRTSMMTAVSSACGAASSR